MRETTGDEQLERSWRDLGGVLNVWGGGFDAVVKLCRGYHTLDYGS